MSSERPLELEPELIERLERVRSNYDRLQATDRHQKKDYSYFPLLRAWLIVGAITGGLLASEKADVGPSDILSWGIDTVEGLNGPTTEQKKAEFLFRTAPESAFVHDLIAVGAVDENGKRIPVNLRNRPATEWSHPAEDFNIDGGHIEGQLDLDQSVGEAILFWGENPNTGDGWDKALWVGIQDSKGDVYFAAADGIVGLADETDAPIFDFREVELP